VIFVGSSQFFLSQFSLVQSTWSKKGGTADVNGLHQECQKKKLKWLKYYTSFQHVIFIRQFCILYSDRLTRCPDGIQQSEEIPEAGAPSSPVVTADDCSMNGWEIFPIFPHVSETVHQLRLPQWFPECSMVMVWELMRATPRGKLTYYYRGRVRWREAYRCRWDGIQGRRFRAMTASSEVNGCFSFVSLFLYGGFSPIADEEKLSDLVNLSFDNALPDDSFFSCRHYFQHVILSVDFVFFNRTGWPEVLTASKGRWKFRKLAPLPLRWWQLTMASWIPRRMLTAGMDFSYPFLVKLSSERKKECQRNLET